jgi:hypothetical protein
MHRVKLYDWVNGMLQLFEHQFETLEQATHFANKSTAHKVKVYNHHGHLVHQVSGIPGNTYA